MANIDKKEIKAQRKAYKKARGKASRPWKALTWLTGPLAIILVAVTIFVGMFDNTVALFTGAYFWELVDEDPNAQYFTSDFATEQERLDRGYE